MICSKTLPHDSLTTQTPHGPEASSTERVLMIAHQNVCCGYREFFNMLDKYFYSEKKYITSGLCGKFMYYWHKLRLITYAITYGNNSKEFKTITWMNDVCCQNTILNVFSGTTGEYFGCISRKRLSKVRPYSMVDLFLKVKKKMKPLFQINLTSDTFLKSSWTLYPFHPI